MSSDELNETPAEDLIHRHPDPLKILLKDRTTDKNIVWATDDYAANGPDFASKSQILPEHITGDNRGLVRPRAEKAHAQRDSRTRSMAEVFTPSWICNVQNNLIDEERFGRSDVFNTTSRDNRQWIAVERVEFPEDGLTWQDYVDGNVLEMACGEAPYLVSRHDAVTGDEIELKQRIGQLDRKLRVIGENTKDPDEWMTWCVRAFEATYGFEFQGDSLLLARLNLLCTFIDYMRSALHRTPTETELENIATVISWNMVQMDGMTFTVPFGDIRKEENALPLLALLEPDAPSEEDSRPVYARIKDWRAEEILEFRTLLQKE